MEILNRINEISFNSSLMREMRAIDFVTQLIESDAGKSSISSACTSTPSPTTRR